MKRLFKTNKGRRANQLVAVCCEILAIAWIAAYIMVPAEDVSRYGLDVGPGMFVLLQFVTYSFVHVDPRLLVVDLIMLVLVGEVLAHCMSAIAFVRLYSLTAFLCGAAYLASCATAGVHSPLCGPHPILMSWCTLGFILNPGKKVDEDVRGPLLILGLVFFAIGSSLGHGEVGSNMLTMAAGAIGGIAYAVGAHICRRA